jgi:hypothetical protein
MHSLLSNIWVSFNWTKKELICIESWGLNLDQQNSLSFILCSLVKSKSKGTQSVDPNSSSRRVNQKVFMSSIHLLAILVLIKIIIYGCKWVRLIKWSTNSINSRAPKREDCAKTIKYEDCLCVHQLCYHYAFTQPCSLLITLAGGVCTHWECIYWTAITVVTPKHPDLWTNKFRFCSILMCSYHMSPMFGNDPTNIFTRSYRQISCCDRLKPSYQKRLFPITMKEIRQGYITCLSNIRKTDLALNIMHLNRFH